MQSITLTVNGEQFSVEADPQSFTAAELNAVERHTGMLVQDWGEKLQDLRVSSLAWTALAWVAVRRAGRFVRWDEFEATLSVKDLLESVVGHADPEPPTPPVARRRRPAVPEPVDPEPATVTA